MQPYVRSASRSSSRPLRSQTTGGPRPGLRAPARKDHECADDARRALRRCSPNLPLLQSTQKTSSRAPAASPGRSFCEQRAPHSALSAVVPGRQLGVPWRPEPFSQLQQQQCRPGGEVEEMHDDAPWRPIISVAGPEPNGNVRAKTYKTVLEQRIARRPYQELLLTGVVQSMMPMYRPGNFGRMRVPDECGHFIDADAAAEPEVS